MSKAWTSSRSSTKAEDMCSIEARPLSAVAIEASPTVPSGPRSCATQPNCDVPWPRRCLKRCSKRSCAEWNFAACSIFTRSGRSASITEVSMSPPWMPYLPSHSL